MWNILINLIPEDQLTAWYGWLTFLTISLPIIAGFCGLFAWKINDKVSSLKDAANQTQLESAKKSADAAGALAKQLEDRQAQWKLSKQDKDAFLKHLIAAPKGKVAIEYIRSDERRSHAFALQVEEMLKTAGYNVWGYMPGFEQAGSAPLIGIMIQITNNEQTNLVGGAIQRAFKAIGIEAIGAHRSNNNYEDDYVVIWIGIKPD